MCLRTHVNALKRLESEFLKLLNLVNENTNVFVISHKGDVLADKFKHTIKFEKKNNFSRML